MRRWFCWSVIGLLTIVLLSLFLNSCAYVVYSKEDENKRLKGKITELEKELDGAQLSLESWSKSLVSAKQQIADLVVEKQDLINEKKELMDKLGKRGYRISFRTDGSCEIKEVKEGSKTISESKAKEEEEVK